MDVHTSRTDLGEALFMAKHARACGFASVRCDTDMVIHALEQSLRPRAETDDQIERATLALAERRAIDNALRDAGHDPADPCAVIEAMAESIARLRANVVGLDEERDAALARIGVSSETTDALNREGYAVMHCDVIEHRRKLPDLVEDLVCGGTVSRERLNWALDLRGTLAAICAGQERSGA